MPMEPIFPANPIERVGFYGGRIAQGLWGEPLNLATDIALVVYLLIFFIKLRKEGFADKPVYGLVMLGGLVGLGSVIFHSYPTRVTLRMDMIPITIFGLCYVFFTLRRFLQLTYRNSILLTLLFLLFSMGYEAAVKNLKIPGMHHLSSIFALIVMGVILRYKQRDSRIGKGFIIASGIYVLALFFRFLDLIVWRLFPLGTHFLWHAGTACVLGLLLHLAAVDKESGYHTRQTIEP
jgi:hypothetical protein